MRKISPLEIFGIYWVFTLILYAFGPFAWVTHEPVLFWSLNIIYILAFVLGWVVSGRVNVGERAEWTEKDDSRLIHKLGYLLYINLFYEVINLFRIFLFSSFDVPALLQKIIYGISNMGDSYNSFQDSVNATSAGIIGGMAITIFNYIWDIWGFATLLFSILYFKKLKIHQKAIAAITVSLEVIAYLARGTNIGVFRVILSFLVFYYLKYVKSSSARSNGSGRNRAKMMVLGTASVVVVVQLFDKIMKSRGGITFWKAGFYNIGGIHINPDSIFFQILPSQFHQLFVSLSGYLSQGYYGMSLSMQVPWKPMCGIGYSMALQNLLGNFVPAIADASYQARIEQYGWDSYTQWHSMYTWFANDFSYAGVIVVMLLFGFVFHRAFHDSLELNNPYAKLMLYFMFLMAVFLPCNNQIGQSTYLLFSFFYVFIKWQLSKRNIKIKI